MAILVVSDTHGFLGEFDDLGWLLEQFTEILIETYSVQAEFVEAIARHEFTKIEIVFGHEGSFPRYFFRNLEALRDPQRASRAQAELERNGSKCWAGYRDGRIHLYRSPSPSHRKIFVMHGREGNAVMLGSANASVNAMTGAMSEAVAIFEADGVVSKVEANVRSGMCSERRLGESETLALLFGRDV